MEEREKREEKGYMVPLEEGPALQDLAHLSGTNEGVGRELVHPAKIETEEGEEVVAVIEAMTAVGYGSALVVVAHLSGAEEAEKGVVVSHELVPWDALRLSEMEEEGVPLPEMGEIPLSLLKTEVVEAQIRQM